MPVAIEIKNRQLATITISDAVAFQVKSKATGNRGFNQQTYVNGLRRIFNEEKVVQLLGNLIPRLNGKQLEFYYAHLHTLQSNERRARSDDGYGLETIFPDDAQNIALSCCGASMLWRIRPSRLGFYFVQDFQVYTPGAVLTSMNYYSTRVIRMNDANMPEIFDILRKIHAL